MKKQWLYSMKPKRLEIDYPNHKLIDKAWWVEQVRNLEGPTIKTYIRSQGRIKKGNKFSFCTEDSTSHTPEKNTWGFSFSFWRSLSSTSSKAKSKCSKIYSVRRSFTKIKLNRLSWIHRMTINFFLRTENIIFKSLKLRFRAALHLQTSWTPFR